MARVFSLVSEGRTERYFFPTLLASCYNFVPSSEKDSHIYIRQSEQYFFVYPPNMYSQKSGGKGLLFRTKTYLQQEDIINNNQKIFGQTFRDRRYIVILDTDGHNQKKIREDEDGIKKCFKVAKIAGELSVFFANQEIESWFIAGVDESFEPFDKGRVANLEKGFFNRNTDDLLDVKQKWTWLLGSNPETLKASSEAGRCFDINKACRLSPSFKKFHEQMCQYL